MARIDFTPVKDCKQGKLTFGEICVQRNKCGRFDKKCPACGGTTIGVEKLNVNGKERHKWIDKGCPKCGGTGKVGG